MRWNTVTSTDLKNEDHRCLVCGAQATGFHFDAQSCSAVTDHPRSSRSSADSSSVNCTPIGSPVEKPKPVYRAPSVIMTAPQSFTPHPEPKEDVSSLKRWI
ncbi:hypothetical protein OESDEN_13814 [Oesophagostomum dentatum]|uniref:Nuclear receptor domain-containing protein n=1 Tax=Oesophagostomum dentatum TaxID=61180 RepID=A0A0B1SNB3_OESDE|nr:hypothetical protein OESDEN_13814 [Oesophagostomum dentatum]